MNKNTDMPDAGKKIKFIMFWYKSQSKMFDSAQRLELLRQWINTCVKYEEYEMAASLKEERCRVMKEYRNESGGLRRKIHRFFVRIKFVARKIRNSLSWMYKSSR